MFNIKIIGLKIYDTEKKLFTFTFVSVYLDRRSQDFSKEGEGAGYGGKGYEKGLLTRSIRLITS